MKNRLLHPFMALFLIVFFVVGCKKEENEPTPKMTLKATIDGKPWEAKDFLVQIQPGKELEDEHLWISAQDPTSIHLSRQLSLNIYHYKTVGFSTVDASKNHRYEDGSISFVDISQGISRDYFGPITYQLTKVENNIYEGTFSGNLCIYDCLSTLPPVHVQGSFMVHLGIQTDL